MSNIAFPPSSFLAALLDPEYQRKDWALRVNAQVDARFRAFAGRLALTPSQQHDAATKVAGIVRRLNREYWGSESSSDHCIMEGSWGKGTQGRPPRDVDIIFVMPYATWQRFEARDGNKQSQLLQEVKDTLADEYPATDLRGDGQVVVVGFVNGHGVEVVPAFELQNGQYWICNTRDGGHYKTVDPHAEIAAVEASDAATALTTRDLVRMLKAWQRGCNVPLKSFQIELLVIDFLPTVTYGMTTRALYDWLVRDFFAYLMRRQNTYVIIPGTGEWVSLGNAWLSRAQSAYDRAVKASAYEEREMPAYAADEWQKIFGMDIS
jgi:hypothetical protein